MLPLNLLYLYVFLYCVYCFGLGVQDPEAAQVKSIFHLHKVGSESGRALIHRNMLKKTEANWKKQKQSEVN